ncbi:uncharacterized protein [Anabrus simplex]|uniref:uncharacterized protein n=1 Tax=Anabrus simplex TaxID=316456 RepID=UPI0035A332D3
MGRLTFLAVIIESCLMVHALPIVDPGLFVIMGVQTCRDGKGYCLLGQDCSLDNDFMSDDLGGHCDGLRSAFTPSAPFVCCRFSGDATTTEMSPTTTDVSLDADGTTITLPLNEEKRLEERIKPKITTKRSYDVHEEPLEITRSSEKDPLNRSSRLDDAKKENDGPFHVELTVDGFVKEEMSAYNKNSSSMKSEHRLAKKTRRERSISVPQMRTIAFCYIIYYHYKT